MTPVATSHIVATNYGQSQEQDIGVRIAPQSRPPPPLTIASAARLKRGPLLIQR